MPRDSGRRRTRLDRSRGPSDPSPLTRPPRQRSDTRGRDRGPRAHLRRRGLGHELGQRATSKSAKAGHDLGLTAAGAAADCASSGHDRGHRGRLGVQRTDTPAVRLPRAERPRAARQSGPESAARTETRAAGPEPPPQRRPPSALRTGSPGAESPADAPPCLSGRPIRFIARRSRHWSAPPLRCGAGRLPPGDRRPLPPSPARWLPPHPRWWQAPGLAEGPTTAGRRRCRTASSPDATSERGGRRAVFVHPHAQCQCSMLTMLSLVVGPSRGGPL